MKKQHIGLVKHDSWLEPYEDAIRGRHEHALYKLNELTNGGKLRIPAAFIDTYSFLVRFVAPAALLTIMLFQYLS